MLSTSKNFPAVIFAVALLAFTAPAESYIASAQTGQSGQAAQALAPSPNSPSVVAASPEVMKLLRIMDASDDARISHAEFMAFMEAEFKRLDLDNDGNLNLRQLEKSQLAVAHHGGTRR